MNNNFTEKANFIWSVADLIRDDFKRSKYAKKLDNPVSKIETVFERLREYRSALISSAVTGKIDVRNS